MMLTINEMMPPVIYTLKLHLTLTQTLNGGQFSFGAIVRIQ